MQFVIPGLAKPAPYLIRGNPVTFWIPAPHFRGDKFTPAEAGAGMTRFVVMNDAVYIFLCCL